MAKLTEVKIPDIGGATGVDVIEILVKSGDKISKDDSLITLESEKASMEIPSPYSGVVKDIKVKEGDKVSEGDLILKLETEEGESKEEKKQAVSEKEKKVSQKEEEKRKDEKIDRKKEEKAEIEKKEETTKEDKRKEEEEAEPALSEIDVHAGPAVRRLARELGVDLTQLKGSGEKGRIVKEDVHEYVKSRLSETKGVGGGISVAPMPAIDFAKFGEIETKPLNKIKKFTGKNVHRSWVTAPHVTQFDEADITELEAFRKQQKQIAEKKGFKLTPLVFIMKAVIASLRAYPQFNASLDASGENLILKHYFHIGVAVDTPNGLVVPVIRDVDQKGLFDLAEELSAVSARAREKGLTPTEMTGGCFTISSLGGIGGTAFTPIVNTPEVAILGVSRAKMTPVWQNEKFVPRLMLPLCLSYDHRVIDGADGARFIVYLSQCLADIKTLLL